MSKIKCPHCNHKPFRSESGFIWHVEHIHGGGIRPSNATFKKDLRRKVRKVINHYNGQALRDLKNDIEERFDCRMNIALRRDAWLSDRISNIEETLKIKKFPNI